MRRGACNTISVYENPSGQRIGGVPVADWKKIKTEYITTDTSYRQLAKKYKMSYRAIADKGNAEGWVDQRDQYQTKTASEMVDAIGRQQVSRAERLQAVADKLLSRVEALVEADEVTMFSSQNMKHLSGVLKDIKEIQGIRSDADMREQEARIKKLEMEASDGNRSAEPIRVIIDGGFDEYSK